MTACPAPLARPAASRHPPTPIGGNPDTEEGGCLEASGNLKKVAAWKPRFRASVKKQSLKPPIAPKSGTALRSSATGCGRRYRTPRSDRDRPRSLKESALSDPVRRSSGNGRERLWLWSRRVAGSTSRPTLRFTNHLEHREISQSEFRKAMRAACCCALRSENAPAAAAP